MDVDYSRPNSINLLGTGMSLKKINIRFYLISLTPVIPAPSSFDIDGYYFDPIFKHNQANALKRTSVYLVMSNLDHDLYNLILWEELVDSLINNIQRGRDPVYLADYTVISMGWS